MSSFPTATSPGISVVHPDRIDTPAGTSEDLRRIDEFQFSMGEGPCLTSLKEHETVTSNDLANDRRWPKWGARMEEDAGVRSCLCFRRLFAAGDSLGALNLYSRQVNAFTSDDLDDGLALAAQVAIALAAAQSEEQLHRAMDSRTTIGQAQGILMERFDLGADQAFAVLVRYSSNLNIKVNQLARDIVRTRDLPE